MTSKELLELFVPHVFTLLGIIIWPAMILIVACFFRTQIGAFIDRINEGEIWGNKFKAPHPQQNRDAAKRAARVEPSLTGGGTSVSYVPDDKTSLVPSFASATVTTTPAPAPKPLPPIVSGTGSPLYDAIEQNIRNDVRLKGMDDTAKLNVLISSQAVIQSHVVFERIYRLIFGSQLYALDLADRPGGIPLVDVENVFNSAKRRFGDFHKDRTFTQWCQFLLDSGLAVELPPQGGTKMAGVTPLGHHFVVYVKEQRYPEPYG